MLSLFRAYAPLAMGLASRSVRPQMANNFAVVVVDKELRKKISAYQLFVKQYFVDLRAASPQAPIQMAKHAKEMGERWLALPADKKAVYEAEAAKLEAARQGVIGKAIVVPSKPATAPSLYLGERLLVLKKESPEALAKDLFAKASQEWKSLSNAQKKVYEDKREVLCAEYEKKMADFVASLSPEKQAKFQELKELKASRPYLPASIYTNAIVNAERDILKKAGVLESGARMKDLIFPKFFQLNKKQQRLFVDMQEEREAAHHKKVKALEVELGFTIKK